MKIESLEINVLKASEIKDGDVIIVKMGTEEKAKLKKEDIQNLYQHIVKMIKRENISIYFFPKNLDINIMKDHIRNIENVKPHMDKDADEK